MSEPLIPEPHYQPVDDRPLPICPICGGLMRRREWAPGHDPALWCDTHKFVDPSWIYPEEEGEE